MKLKKTIKNTIGGITLIKIGSIVYTSVKSTFEGIEFDGQMNFEVSTSTMKRRSESQDVLKKVLRVLPYE